MAIQSIKDYDVALHFFHEGSATEAYDFFGSHFCEIDGEKGVIFRVWAPKAASVSVVGDFNHWDRFKNTMHRTEHDGSVWELFIPNLKQYDIYKYSIESSHGQINLKADPYGVHMETRPHTASKIYELEGYKWKDAKWLENRKNKNIYDSAINIYEMHLSSWMEKKDEDELFNYMELAKKLIPYVKKMGYTHIEIMPVAEYPFDGSWGYQQIGYYAPTSRFGTPHDFMEFVDYCHQNDIGLILDWVPAHFPKDAAGLYEFDGSYCYEYSEPLKREHLNWGTRVFDWGKPEVQSFLISNANYWFEKYHVDGLRVDAVASMLYLDYDRKDGQWQRNSKGGNENLEAISFLQRLNTALFAKHENILMIAEESTAWPKVTGTVKEDGLNFSYKWNMGWMHDFLDYMKLDPYFRKDNHHKMTFAMSYNESEKYILVLSHDEVVHLKCSMLNKMPGLEGDKFKNLMVGYAFMMGHPGKKLLFMGQEFAQLQEWSEERELDWYLLENPNHANMQKWVKALLHLYRKNPAMYELDSSWGGFEWVNANDAEHSTFSFIRKSKDGKNNLLFVCNFTPMEWKDYRVGVPRKKTYKLILDSDSEEFGGNGKKRPLAYKAMAKECDGRKFSFAYPLSPYGVAVFRF